MQKPAFPWGKPRGDVDVGLGAAVVQKPSLHRGEPGGGVQHGCRTAVDVYVSWPIVRNALDQGDAGRCA